MSGLKKMTKITQKPYGNYFIYQQVVGIIGVYWPKYIVVGIMPHGGMLSIQFSLN